MQLLDCVPHYWERASVIRELANRDRWWIFKYSYPGFYQAMWELELQGLVEKMDTDFINEFGDCKIRYYRKKNGNRQQPA